MGDLIWVGIEWTWVLKDLLDRERGSLIALIFFAIVLGLICLVDYYAIDCSGMN